MKKILWYVTKQINSHVPPRFHTYYRFVIILPFCHLLKKNEKDKVEVLFSPFPVPCPSLQQQEDTCSKSSILPTRACFYVYISSACVYKITYGIVLSAFISANAFFHPTLVCLQDISIWTHAGLVQFIDLLCNYTAICSPILPTFNLLSLFSISNSPRMNMFLHRAWAPSSLLNVSKWFFEVIVTISLSPACGTVAISLHQP